tara:strand:+ start:6845 stop:7309 length:465 start_codon:yes stop_codon:yes gene_type:complete
MRQKYHQGKYTIKNPQKYSGKGEPTFRSSWEFTFMNFCDDNPSVVAWASEPCKITYQNPLNGKVTAYVPDFVIVYMDKAGQKKAELVEIKPATQSKPDLARRRTDKMAVVQNYAKWDAATKWANKRGMRFRVLNEGDIYQNTKKPKPVKPRKRK